MDKNKIIEEAYYDLGGFNSIKEHLKDARVKDKSITIDDIKNWRDRNIEQKKNLKGFNSFVVDKPKIEYQMDLAFFDMNDPVYIGALCMIDIFTKYASVMPFKTKKPDEILECIKEGIKRMGGKPKLFYTDNEGSFNSKEIQQYFKDNNIEHLITNTHAGVVERFIRTIKDYIYKRTEHYKKPWHEYIFPAVLIYNNKSVHSVTKHTPKDATKPENEFAVKLNLLLNKKQNRLYPELKIGDTVKIYKKKDLKHKKERFSVWSENKYEIESIGESILGQKTYSIKGLPKTYLRHELLKVL
jgi:hypothetical protein